MLKKCLDTLVNWLMPIIMACGLCAVINGGSLHPIVDINLGVILFAASCLESMGKIKKWTTDFVFGTVLLAYTAFMLSWGETLLALFTTVTTVIIFVFACSDYTNKV